MVYSALGRVIQRRCLGRRRVVGSLTSGPVQEDGADEQSPGLVVVGLLHQSVGGAGRHPAPTTRQARCRADGRRPVSGNRARSGGRPNYSASTLVNSEEAQSPD